MRASHALVCLAACGRIHIEPLDNDIDATVGDAAACAQDGAACDDHNICTATSTCSGGVCVGAMTDPCTVADSETEFSTTTQGVKGWYYGTWLAGTDPDGYQPTDFITDAWLSGGWRPPDYQDTGPTYSWAYLQWWGGHPAVMPTAKLPVRRWVSDVSGHAEAVIHHAKADTTSGDGTRAMLFVDGVELFSRDIAFDDDVGFTEVVPIELKVGSTVELMLHYIASEGSDSTNSSLIIRSR